VRRPVHLVFTGPRHNSATQYTFMHSTRPTSNAGQLSGCTSLRREHQHRDRNPILTISHNMKLTALAPGDMLD
jgi:hypothetical protein